MKLYKSYYCYSENEKIMLFALWPSLEAELYSEQENVSDITSNIYDISNRLRGKRRSAMKIKNSNDVNNLILIAKRIIELNKQ